MSWVCRLVIDPVIIRNIIRPSNIALEDHPNQISFHEKHPFIVDVQLPYAWSTWFFSVFPKNRLASPFKMGITPVFPITIGDSPFGPRKADVMPLHRAQHPAVGIMQRKWHSIKLSLGVKWFPKSWA